MPPAPPGLRDHGYMHVAAITARPDLYGAVPDDAAAAGFLSLGHARTLARMTAMTTELHPCAGGCGEMVRGTWKRGHKAKFDAHGTCADGAVANGGGRSS